MSEELKAALARIACLEGEIAKRDEELAACRVSVENCEVFRARIAELEGLYQELIRDFNALSDEPPVSEAKAKSAAKMPCGTAVSNVYEAYDAGMKAAKAQSDKPSHASQMAKRWGSIMPKAQGVVMPPSPYMTGSQPTDFTDYELGEIHGRIAMWEEVKRINAAPVQHVSVPDGFERYRLANKFCEQRLVTDDHVRAIVVDAFASGYGFGIAAAPAAPAADAGASLIEWTKDAVEWGGALNYAAWEFVNECPEKSALLFNNTKGPLRAAIMKYAEIVAANAKDSSHD